MRALVYNAAAGTFKRDDECVHLRRGTPPEAKKRYLCKIATIAGIDPFTLCKERSYNNPAIQTSSLPSLDESCLVSYLVLKTSYMYVSIKQYKLTNPWKFITNLSVVG